MTTGTSSPETPIGDEAPREDAGSRTRRAFLDDVTRKALYLAPIVMTLTASQAQALHSIPCYPLASPCITAHDNCCAPNICANFMSMTQCCGPTGIACSQNMDCCSNMCMSSMCT